MRVVPLNIIFVVGQGIGTNENLSRNFRVKIQSSKFFGFFKLILTIELSCYKRLSNDIFLSRNEESDSLLLGLFKTLVTEQAPIENI